MAIIVQVAIRIATPFIVPTPILFHRPLEEVTLEGSIIKVSHFKKNVKCNPNDLYIFKFHKSSKLMYDIDCLNIRQNLYIQVIIMEEKPFILDAEYPIDDEGSKVRVVFEIFLKKNDKDTLASDEELFEGLQELFGDMPKGICTNIAAAILVLPLDPELARDLLDVVSLPIVKETVPEQTEAKGPPIKDKEDEFMIAYN
ncbi:MAG: hypothetical protein WAW15_02110 [Minisyncoccales bacterium]|jgi:hypothetical protein